MKRRYSLAHLTAIALSPPALVSVAAKAGYDFVGLRLLEVTPGDAWPIVRNPSLIRETQHVLETTGVELLDVELARLGPSTVVEDFRPMLETAAQLGARHVLTQAHDSDRARATDNYRALCDLAAEFGMSADVEFLTWTDMRDLRSAWSLVSDADRPNAGVMIDSLHFFRSGCCIDEIDAVPAERLHFVQLSDAVGLAPSDAESLIFTARYDRLAPGTGSLPLADFVRHIPADVPIAIEVPNRALATMMSDEQRVHAALLAARALEAAVSVP